MSDFNILSFQRSIKNDLKTPRIHRSSGGNAARPGARDSAETEWRVTIHSCQIHPQNQHSPHFIPSSPPRFGNNAPRSPRACASRDITLRHLLLSAAAARSRGIEFTALFLLFLLLAPGDTPPPPPPSWGDVIRDMLRADPTRSVGLGTERKFERGWMRRAWPDVT